MSFIDNISVGLSSKKSTFNLGQDTHTTAEIGYFQPTFCRDVVPGSHMEISSRNLVRLSPLAVPTMGRIALRNYFYFVDMATLWTPFDALRNQTNYTYGDGSVYTPTATPVFMFSDVYKYLCEYNYEDKGASGTGKKGEALKQSIYASVYDIRTGELCDDTQEGFDLNDVIFEMYDGTVDSTLPYVLKTKTKVWIKTSDITGGSIGVPFYSSNSGTTAVLGDLSKYVDVTNQNADFSMKAGANYFICGKFIGPAKRLRKHFIGCGYTFNPYDDTYVNPFKLLAVYKAWFDTFAVQRTINFNNTNCYKLIKKLSETSVGEDTNMFSIVAGASYNDKESGNKNTLVTIELFIDFLNDLSNICYNLPADYFSASDTSAQRGAWTSNIPNGDAQTLLHSLTYGAGDTESWVEANSTFQQTPKSYAGNSNSPTAIGNEMATRLLRFINKRSVVGRKIADLLKLNGEIDLHNNEHETVHHLGDDKVDINISDVMSLASTEDASLGDYAGRALGMGNTDSFSYDTKAYGILLCLSAIVPQSGYFQGILHENTATERFDYFTQEFDALGYQPLLMNELVADTQFMSSTGLNSRGTNHGIFGIAPRYQHLKVGRNICNGDISLPSMQSVMLPYTLDRHFITCAPKSGSKFDFQTVVLPPNSPETFRQIRATEGYGDYNRIFQYVNGDYDHFIIQSVIDCKVSAPMKSISNSYDTFDEAVDDTTINVNKQ